MKLAWFVWYDEEDMANKVKPEVWFTQPDSWRPNIPIVYAILEQDD